MRPGQIPYRVGREETRERIEVPLAVHRLVERARQLDRVGGRELLRHDEGEYPGPLPSELSDRPAILASDLHFGRFSIARPERADTTAFPWRKEASRGRPAR